MTPDAVIAGTGMTRFGKFAERGLRSLATEAASDALADAGLTSADVDIVFYANAAAGVLHGQEMIRGQSALRRFGVLGKPIINVENACASSSTAFAMGVMAVSAGAADVALVVGAEKLTHADKARSVTAIATAVDLEEDTALRTSLSASLLGWDGPVVAGDPDWDSGSPGDDEGGSKFMNIYAGITRGYLARSGGSVYDLAVIAAKSHANGSLNPKAQYRDVVTPEEVLASRMVAPPLTLLMCSPIGDGAAAVVICSSDYAKRLSGPVVHVRGVSIASGVERAEGDPGSAEAAAGRAYAQAGVGPRDLDVVELHDAAATGELVGYEELGLCEVGDGPKLLASGDTHLGGRVPVNPSGGLLSRGHPIGATGCAQIVEIADQLRGRGGARQVPGARIGLTKNSGGYLGSDAGATVVSVLAAGAASW
jgi:acetyl-CoA acetyltransferase